MSYTNDILPFATGGGANVASQAAYLADTTTPTGFGSGVAASAKLNKVWRQSSFVASALAQLTSDALQANVLDNGVIATLEGQFGGAINLLDYGLDVGPLNSYQVAYNVVVPVLYDGLKLRFKAGRTNTGGATFSPSSISAAPIWTQQGVALTGGEILVGTDVELVWNTSSNVTGAWILLTIGGIAQGMSARDILTLTGNNTLTSASSGIGGTVIINNAAASTQTLPLASTVRKGSRIELINYNSGLATVAVAGSDTIAANVNNILSSIVMQGGGNLVLESNGVNAWYAVGGTEMFTLVSDFGRSGTVTGISRNPNGMWLQWGVTASLAPGATNITLPWAYGLGMAAVVVTGSNASLLCSASVTSYTTFTLTNSGGSAGTFNWIALGWS